MNVPHKKEKPLLLGLVVKKYSEDGMPYVRLNWGRVTLFLILFTLFAWMSLSTMLFAYFKYLKDFDTVKFSDMILLPLKYSAHRQEMGDRHVERGLQAIGAHDYNNGIRLLRLGLAR